jgi:hypothetical protein
MNDELLFWQLSQDAFDNCWICLIHDLLNKRGNVLNEGSWGWNG